MDDTPEKGPARANLPDALTPMSESSPDRAGYAIAATTIAFWAGFVLVSRIAGTGDLSPFDITALRFGTAALVLAPVWIWLLRVPLFTTHMFVLAGVGGIAYALSVYGGFRLAPAAHGALLVSLKNRLQGWVAL